MKYQQEKNCCRIGKKILHNKKTARVFPEPPKKFHKMPMNLERELRLELQHARVRLPAQHRAQNARR